MKGGMIMLIRITPKNSTHAVVASTRDKTTLEGLDTLCNLYEHMLHLQENQGYVYDNLDTIVEAVWDYVGCDEGTAQCWEVSQDPATIMDRAAVNSRGEAAPGQVSSIRFTLDQHNKINQSETVFSVGGLFHEDFHFNGPAEDENGYREEPEVLEGVLIDELYELNHEELKQLRDKVYHQPNQVMWVYDYGGGTYESTQP
jgi:hypothetical protein